MSRWAIVLAGGNGERMRPTITSWLGTRRPKQYCTFVGSRSMLQHTWDRASQLVSHDRLITVVDRSHRRFLKTGDHGEFQGKILHQPCQKGTAPGVWLPATYIKAADPSGVVFIFPSDHYICPNRRFLSHLEKAASLVTSGMDQLILLGATPDGAETEYGWIRTESASVQGSQLLPQELKPIKEFLEKPTAEIARQFFESGCYWNTMIIVVRISVLWELGHQILPGMMGHFEQLLGVLRGIHRGRVGSSMEEIALRHIYRTLEPANFSRSFLQRATKSLLLWPMRNVEWSDWGSPARIEQSLARSGKRPHFCCNQ